MGSLERDLDYHSETVEKTEAIVENIYDMNLTWIPFILKDLRPEVAEGLHLVPYLENPFYKLCYNWARIDNWYRVSLSNESL